MTSKLDLFFYTENRSKELKMQWFVVGVQNITKVIKSPSFSFAPESSDAKDWFLSLEHYEEHSISIFLNNVCTNKNPICVKYTVVCRNTDGTKVFDTSGWHIMFSNECKKLSNMNQILQNTWADTLVIDFSFVVYGLDVDTKVMSYIDEPGANEFSKLKESFNEFKKNGKFSDLKIHVGDQTFEAHKFIFRLRAPKFLDEHLRDLCENEITLHGLDPVLFNEILIYICDGKEPLLALAHSPLEVYEIASRYDLKRLQTRCVEELEQMLEIHTAVKYLKLAIKYQDKAFKETILTFIGKNFEVVSSRREWKVLVSTNPGLEDEV